MTTWEYCWLHWSSHQVTYLTEEGERHEFPAYKDSAVAITRIGLAGWELVNVYHNMWYVKRERALSDLAEHDVAQADVTDADNRNRD